MNTRELLDYSFKILTSLLGEEPREEFSVTVCSGICKIKIPPHISIKEFKKLPEMKYLEIDICKDYKLITFCCEK